MTKDQFTRAVEQSGAHPPHVLETAVRYFLVRNQPSFGNGDVQACRQLAAMIAGDKEETGSAGVLLGMDSTPFQKNDDQERLAAIAGTVGGVRRELFGSEEAPWTSERYSEAIRWLETEYRRTHRTPTKEEIARAGELVKQARPLIREIFKLTGAVQVSSVTWQYERIRYVRVEPPGFPLLRIRGDSPLLPLARETSRLAGALDCSQADLVTYILTGEPPFLPRVQVQPLGKWISRGYKEPLNGSDYERRYVQVTLEDPELSERELRGIFKALSELRSEKPEDAALRELLRALDGVPERPSREFWQDVSTRWKKAGFPKGTPDALRMRFNRLPSATREKLQRTPD